MAVERLRRLHEAQAAFYGGVALWTVALISPLDNLAEDLLSAHMAQHLLLAELYRRLSLPAT